MKIIEETNDRLIVQNNSGQNETYRVVEKAVHEHGSLHEKTSYKAGDTFTGTKFRFTKFADGRVRASNG